MIRNLLVVLSVVAVLGLASSAWAEARYGDGGGGESNWDCICEEIIGVGPTCTNNLLENCGAACNTSANCAPGRVCIDKTFTGCASAGAGTCQRQMDQCLNGGCVTSSSIGNIIDCPSNVIPTLSQWGLILFGMLLLSMMFWTIRRRGLPTHMAAGLLVIGMMGFTAATVAYSQLQSERVCGESDVAVEFVNDILNG